MKNPRKEGIMEYNASGESRRPAYLELYYKLRGDIEAAAYPFGSKLPSKRMLAEKIGMSVITVEHAYALLIEEGYIESRQRSGYFVIYKEGDFISSPAASISTKVMRHSLPKSPFPFSVMAKTMRKVLLDWGDGIFEKSPSIGCLELRQAICAYLKRAVGITVLPDQVIIGAGSEYLYGLVVQLLGKDRIYAVENPSYKKIRQVYEAHGAVCRLLDMGNDGIKSEALAETDATVLHVTPFCSFPSLVSASIGKRREYLRWAKRCGGVIVEDNYDSELTVSKKNEETLFSLSPEKSVIYMNTFSRTIAPSVRVGYMVLPLTMCGDFEEKLGFYSCTVPLFEQYVLAELINSGDFERHISRVRRERRKLNK